MRVLITFTFLCLFNFAALAPAHATMVGFWDFNEGAGDFANDGSGFGNHASGLESGWTAGKYGSGTTSDNITVQPDASLLPTSSLSISAWVRIDEFNGLQRRIVETVPNYGFLFNPQNNVGETPFLYSMNLQNYGFEFQNPAQGEWFNTAVSWDGTTAQYYFNGNPTPPVAAPATINTNFVPLMMGAPGYTLDEVRVYDHALSRDEVLRDMNFDSTGTGSPVVPEPATVLLLGGGLVGAVLRKLRRRQGH